MVHMVDNRDINENNDLLINTTNETNISENIIPISEQNNKNNTISIKLKNFICLQFLISDFIVIFFMFLVIILSNKNPFKLFVLIYSIVISIILLLFFYLLEEKK